jgi:hypothetical protein
MFFKYAVKVFCINAAIVIKPTPPGTGVIQLHFGATFLKSTDMPYDEDDDPYSKKNVEKRRKEKEENLRALREQYGIDTDSD